MSLLLIIFSDMTLRGNIFNVESRIKSNLELSTIVIRATTIVVVTMVVLHKQVDAFSHACAQSTGTSGTDMVLYFVYTRDNKKLRDLRDLPGPACAHSCIL